MSLLNNNFPSYISNIKCNIVVCGSTLDGESIIIILNTDDKKTVIVVDSFRNDNLIVPINILEKKGIECVDYLFWTHPHNDHSVGILDIIKKFAIKKICIPTEMYSLIDYAREDSIKTFNYILDVSRKKSDRRYKNQPSVLTINSSCSELISKYILNNGKKLDVYFDFFSPISYNMLADVKKAYPNLNDCCIGFNLIIGDFVFSSTSDVENNTIFHYLQSRDNLNFGYYPNIVKIPHHGSSTSDQILNLFDNCKESIGTCTSKKKFFPSRYVCIERVFI